MEKDSLRKPYRILSLSGGGMRGIYQSYFLHELSKRLPQKPLNENFDLIIGTSTGAIIALVVAFSRSLDVVTKMYESKGGTIFGKLHWWDHFLEGPLYNGDTLRKALKAIFGVKKFGECPGKVLVPATTLDQFAPRILSNQNDADKELLVVDVLMASSAGPTYFQEVKPKDEARSYVDGGLWANTPSLIGVLEAHLAGANLMDIRVLSIGNGETPLGITPSDFRKIRPTSGEAAKTVMEMMFAAQSGFADVYTKHLIGDGRHGVLKFVRINQSLREQIELDDAEKAVEQLKAPAEKEARNRSQEIEQLLSLGSAAYEYKQELLERTKGNYTEEEQRYGDLMKKLGDRFANISEGKGGRHGFGGNQGSGII